MLHGLRTLILDVKDLAAAKAFYTGVVGHAPYFDQPFYVGFDVDGYELGLRPAEGQPGHYACFGVDDVPHEVARLRELGATVKEEPQNVGGTLVAASVVDPFGNTLGLLRNLDFAPKLVAAAADDVSARNIRIERTIALPRKALWKLWATTEGIKSWLVDDARIELRPGGAYEVYFLLDKPAGFRGSESCRVLSFVPERMLSFTWNAPPHLEKTRFEHTWVVVELQAVDDGAATLVTLTHLGWPESGLAKEPQWEQTLQYFEKAWASVFDDLATFATTGKKP